MKTSWYQKDSHWLVTDKCQNGLSIHATKEDIEKGAIPHKDYFPGDIITDRYFSPENIWILNGTIVPYDGLYREKVRKYRSIDDPWEIYGAI